VGGASRGLLRVVVVPEGCFRVSFKLLILMSTPCSDWAAKLERECRAYFGELW
jgi:hypothetical protein